MSQINLATATLAQDCDFPKLTPQQTIIIGNPRLSLNCTPCRWSRRREDPIPQQFALSYMTEMVKVLVRDDEPEIPGHILLDAEDVLADTLTMTRARIQASSPITDADSEPEGQ